MAELYPKGTIVRFKVGPLAIYQDANAKTDDLKLASGSPVWAGQTGIYVGPIDLPIGHRAWHLVMVESGDVPVLAHYIEPDPASEDKNKRLLAELLVGDSEQYREVADEAAGA